MCVYRCRDGQYFYSIYVKPSVELAHNASMVHSGLHYSGLAAEAHGGHYCGPINPHYMLNPMKWLSEEFLPDWPIFAKFLRIISSNACILSILFIFASVSRVRGLLK